MHSKPQFRQGVCPFAGTGLADAEPPHSPLTYPVPLGKRSQCVYFRAGNSSGELVSVVLMRDGSPMRCFPVGAKADVRVALAVAEDLPAGTAVEVPLAAPESPQGTVISDVGMMEI